MSRKVPDSVVAEIIPDASKRSGVVYVLQHLPATARILQTGCEMIPDQRASMV